MKRIACDSSSLISLSNSCLLWLLRDLNAEFMISSSVEQEVVDKPLRSDRFAFSALRLKQAIGDGRIVVASEPRAYEISLKLMRLANSLLVVNKKPVKLLHVGEAHSLALLVALEDADTFLIDERTTRLLIEDLDALVAFISRRLHTKPVMDKGIAKELKKMLKGIRVVRSSEIVAFAFDEGLFKKLGSGKTVLRAVLCALRNSGCALSTKEIKQYVDFLA